jgi:peptide/nickel transport system permease protein
MTVILAADTPSSSEGLDELAVPGGEEARRYSRRALLVRRFLRNRPAVVGVALYVLLVVVAIVGPMLYRWSYLDIDREARAYLAAPSWRHWLGTTQSGRDVLAMTMEGLRKSMLISLVVGIGSTTIAALVGSFAAYFSGWIERISLWVIDMLLVLPSFLIIAIFMRNVHSHLAIWLAFWLMALGWMLSARVVRSLTMSVRDREYVTAAKYMGVSGPRIIVRHILPNISSLLIIDACLAIGLAVLNETGLSFFGFGIRSPEVSLGTVISEGSRMATTFPWVFLGGAGFLMAMLVAIFLIGDGLRDAFDPSSQSGGKA